MPRPGTIFTLFVAAAPFVTMHGALAAAKEPPYEAVIEADEAFARCGPGKTYYPTSRLNHGDRVTVRRHDPGGWFMIDPPPGSFSLIRAEDVSPEGISGTVKQLDEGQATVRVGSALDPTNDSIFQRRLSSGERVEILGAVTIPRRDRQVPMFKIRPPKGEFRWIDGMSLAPLDPQIRPQVREQVGTDPFAGAPNRNNRPGSVRQNAIVGNRSPRPATPQATGNSQPTLHGARLVTAPVPVNSPASTGASGGASTNRSGSTAVPMPAAHVDPAVRLDQIDLAFREMIQRQPATWNLAQIERAYRDLENRSISAALRSQLEMRFSAVEHYKQVKGEYDDYFRLVSNTVRRDAELAAVQNSLAPENTRPPIATPGQVSPPGSTAAGAPNSSTAPLATMPTMTLPNPQGSPSPGSQTPPPQPPASNETRQQPGPQESPRLTGPVLGPPIPDDNATQASPSSPPNIQPSAPQADVANPGLSNPNLARPLVVSPNPSNPNPASQNLSSPNLNGTGSSTPPDRGLGGFPPVSTEPSSQPAAAPSPVYRSPASSPPGVAPDSQNLWPQNPGSQGARTRNSAPQYTGPPNSAPIHTPVAPGSLPPQQYGQDSNPAPAPAPTPVAPQNNFTYSRPPFSGGPAPAPAPGGASTNEFRSAWPSRQQTQVNPPIQLNHPMQPNPAATIEPQPASAPPAPALAAPRQIRPQIAGGLDGAGVVQRAATPVPGGPKHVLLTLNGRILAYLYPDRGVNLDAYIGRPMGIFGPRTFRPELHTDLIVVQRMVPVRLVP